MAQLNKPTLKDKLFNDVTTIGKTIQAAKWMAIINILVIILDALVQNQGLLDPKTAAIVTALYPMVIMVSGWLNANQHNWNIPPSEAPSNQSGGK